MELQVDKINRQVHFITAQALVENGKQPLNNTWIYDRAPDGYKFILHSVFISVAHNPYTATGIFAIYDGHEYTGWNQWPGVESRELLGRLETDAGTNQSVIMLNGWECKEYTIGTRSLSGSLAYKVCAIVWYYLRKMTDLEKYQYATIQPRGEHYRKGGPSTVEQSEGD